MTTGAGAVARRPFDADRSEGGPFIPTPPPPRELRQRDTRGSRVLARADFAVAPGRPTFVAGHAPTDAHVALRAGRVLQADVGRIARLFVATLLGSVALGHALAPEVADVRLDRTVILPDRSSPRGSRSESVQGCTNRRPAPTDRSPGRRRCLRLLQKGQLRAPKRRCSRARRRSAASSPSAKNVPAACSSARPRSFRRCS